MKVNSTYMLNVMNINFVLICINYVPIFVNFYLPEEVQFAYYPKISNT